MTGSAHPRSCARGRFLVKVVVCLLLSYVATLVALPLYRQEVWLSGPPEVTEWTGIVIQPLYFWKSAIEEPIFSIIPGLAIPAAIAFALNRRTLSLTLMCALLGFFAVHYVGGRSLLRGGEPDPWQLNHCRIDCGHTGFFYFGMVSVIASLMLAARRCPEQIASSRG